MSALGGALFNLGQVLVMMLMTGTAEFLYYLPILAVFGVVFGFIMGAVSNLIANRVKF